MLSLSCKASIKAVVYLGSKSDSGEKPGIQEIAKFINENEHTVGKLLQKLVKQDVIKSSKGPKGGFYITTEQKTQPIIKIVEAIDGKEVFNQCGLGLSKCSETRPCPIHNDFKNVRESFKQMCENNEIKMLYENVNNGLAYLIG
jgi:Rrf2 family protein